jgi:hypothetical protein
MSRKAIPYEVRESQILDICTKENYTYEGLVSTFKNAESKIQLKCNIDGNVWTPSIRNFITNGSRCPKCFQNRCLLNTNCKNINTKSTHTYFYLQKLSCTSHSALKYGITTRSVEKRLSEQSRNSKYTHSIIFAIELYSKEYAIDIENIVKETIPSSFLTPALLPDGYSETCLEKYLLDIKEIVYNYMFS